MSVLVSESERAGGDGEFFLAAATRGGWSPTRIRLLVHGSAWLSALVRDGRGREERVWWEVSGPTYGELRLWCEDRGSVEPVGVLVDFDRMLDVLAARGFVWESRVVRLVATYGEKRAWELVNELVDRGHDLGWLVRTFPMVVKRGVRLLCEGLGGVEVSLAGFDPLYCADGDGVFVGDPTLPFYGVKVFAGDRWLDDPGPEPPRRGRPRDTLDDWGLDRLTGVSQERCYVPGYWRWSKVERASGALPFRTGKDE